MSNSEDKPFVNKAVVWKAHGGHPTRKLVKHETSAKHTIAVDKQLAYMTTKAKGSVLTQIIEGAHKISEKTMIENRNYIKKLIKTLYFMLKKRWAHSDNFEDLINFIAFELELNDLRCYIEGQKQITSTNHLFISIFC